jgi:hypothetical protein
MILDNVDRFRVIEPSFEAVRVVLSFLGEKHTPAYVQGVSGAAFRVAGICPCAPTCSGQMGTTALIKLLGYEYSEHMLGWKDDDVTDKIGPMIEAVKASIAAGRPALVWHAFTNAEWDVVAGFDDAEGVFYGRGSYAGQKDYAKAKQSRAKEAVKICPAFGALVIGKKVGNLDEKAAEVAALKEAVRHAKDPKNLDKAGGENWVMLEGLAAYNRWVEDWKKPDKKRGAGDSYCFGIYRSTHGAAADFLKEIAPKHARASEHLLSAARGFLAEVEALSKAEGLIWWSAPGGPDADRNAKLWPILSEARDHYAKAIDSIEKALGLL